MFNNKFKHLSIHILALPLLFIVGVGCDDDPNRSGRNIQAEIERANQMLARAGTTIADFLAASPDAALSAEIATDAATLEADLAIAIAKFKSLPKTKKIIALTKSLENAAPKIAQVSAAVANPPSPLLGAALDVAKAVRDMLKSAERANLEIVGEQRIAGVEPQLPEPSDEEQAIIEGKLTFEADEAAANGEEERELQIRLAQVIHLQRRADAEPGNIQTLPPVDPTPEVPSTQTQEGAFASLAQLSNERRRDIDPRDDALPATCDILNISQDTCSVIPTANVARQDPLQIITTDYAQEVGEEIADFAAELGEEAVAVIPTDLFDASNAVFVKVNDASAAFLNGDLANPLLTDLSIATLEVELAQIEAWLNHFPQTAEVVIFRKQVAGGFVIIEQLAAQLEVALVLSPDTADMPDLALVDITGIPSTPPPGEALSAFDNSRSLPLTASDALREGILKGGKALYEIVGENVQTLHEPLTDAPLSIPTPDEVAEVTQNYESAAIRADNDGDPVRAASLRQLEAGFNLRVIVALPVPASTPLNSNPMSQQGMALFLAILAEERAAAQSPADYSPAGCNARTWDDNTCTDFAEDDALPLGH